jgi:hypothetical protein
MSKYKLIVSAGTSYNASDQINIPVNISGHAEEFTSLQSSRADIKLAIRIQDFQGDFNSTDDYFKHLSHSNDQFSIQFSITFNDDDINGDDLIWGNDFDKPIRDILPLGFSVGLSIMKWTIDPSLDADPYSDTPYLYGKALASINKITQDDDYDWPKMLTYDSLRCNGIPSKPEKRMKYFVDSKKRKNFTFKKNQQYSFDFYTPYITLGKEFAIKLPGYRLNVEQYCGSQPLRYTLKNNKTGAVYLVIVFNVTRVK